MYIHIPKTGGVSVEKSLHIPHDHQPFVCNHSFTSIRDPVERLSSAFYFCKNSPWDKVLYKKNMTAEHCCHSRFLSSQNVNTWISAVLQKKIDCRMPGAGFPHSFVAPTSFWIKNTDKVSILRTHCLTQDARTYLNISIGWENKSPNSNKCGKNITTSTYNLILHSHHKNDFNLLYNKSFSNLQLWKLACESRKCSPSRRRPVRRESVLGAA